MTITIYSFSHRTSALKALTSVTQFLDKNNLDYEVVQLKESAALPVSINFMREILAAQDPETRIFKKPRNQSIDDWTTSDILAKPSQALKSPLTIETNDSGHVTHVMAGINEDLLGLFIPHRQRKAELYRLLQLADAM